MRKLAPASFIRRPRLWLLLLATASVSVGVAIAACANPDTYTPMCTPNVGVEGGGFGIDPLLDDGGCEPLAVCVPGCPPNVSVNCPAALCCVNDGGVKDGVIVDGGAFTGNDLASCLYGYGDPSCPFLLSTVTDGGDAGPGVIYNCSLTPVGDTGTGGGSGSSSSSSGSSSSTGSSSSSSSGTGGADGGDGG
jgi:hypothetical protein